MSLTSRYIIHVLPQDANTICNWTRLCPQSIINEFNMTTVIFLFSTTFPGLFIHSLYQLLDDKPL